ncbi:MAG: hypothetical protein GX868_06445 [Actinobacteria bacterium]|nr:hypothetical protein [Actinomycetota bacterium]
MDHDPHTILAPQRAYAMRLVVPAATELVRPVRLAVGGLASVGDFTIETVEELQLAANELLVVLMTVAGSAELELELQLDEFGAFRMDATARQPTGTVDLDVISVSERILSVMADEYRLEIGDGIVAGGFMRHPDTWSDEDADHLDPLD